MKVFDSSGTFIKLFSLPNDDADTKLYVLDVATDMKDNIYVLVALIKRGGRVEWVVYEFNNTGDLQHKCPVWGGDWDSRLTVIDSGKVLLLSGWRDGFLCTTLMDSLFASLEDILTDARDITAANDDRVMVLDWGEYGVHIFSEHGDHPEQA